MSGRSRDRPPKTRRRCRRVAEVETISPSEPDPHRALEVASPLKFGVTRWPQAYSTPRSTNATGLQIKLGCVKVSDLFAGDPGYNVGVYTFQIPLAATVDRRFSVHQCWYQIQPLPRLRRIGRCGPARHRPAGWAELAVPLGVGQRVDKAETRHNEGAPKIGHQPEAVGDLAPHLDAVRKPNPRSSLPKGPGAPLNGWTSPLIVPP